MNVIWTARFLLAFGFATCNANGLLYDIQMSEVVDGKEINTEEKEVFIEESYVTPEPPVIYMTNPEGDFDPNSYREEDAYLGREEYNLTEIELEMAFKKEEAHHPEEHMNFQMAFGLQSGNNKNWTPWTCCRRVVNIQSRQRILNSPRIELEYRRCSPSAQYCQAHECKDTPFICGQFISSFGNGICNPGNSMATFMSQNCPQRCNFCGGSFVTSRPITRPTNRPWWERETTTRPRWERQTTTRSRPRPTRPIQTTQRPINQNLAKVTIYTHDNNPPYPSYKYSLSNLGRTYPWRSIPVGGSELSSFYLYRRPTGMFTQAIYFCSARNRNTGLRKYNVKKSMCTGAWTQDFVLYSSRSRSRDVQVYYVGKRGKPYWTSRISTSFPSKGYTNSLLYFYGPKVRSTGPVTDPPTPRPFTTRPVRTTRRPRPITTERPFPPTTRPTRPGVQPTNAFNKECLDAHNLFRAVHNVPLLKWSPELARTSQAWANQLKRIAPERPDQLRMPNLRTRNWPHSESGKGYRNRGDGENIAWDMSDDGSPAKESVMRWYAELFYYDRRQPTRAPAADKPVGHLTQMLWKDTTHLGCGVSKTTLDRGHYKLLSTWTVSHYSPGGNVRYPSQQMTNRLYDEQVPDMRQGSCLTKTGACNNGNQCMAFGSPTGRRATCTCSRNQPTCRGMHGCLAWCENKTRAWPWKDECQGTTECRCGAQGAVCK